MINLIKGEPDWHNKFNTNAQEFNTFKDSVNSELVEVNSQLAENTSKIETIEINVKHPPVPLAGAKGDKITDDTVAIQNIINYCIGFIQNYGLGVNGNAPTLVFSSGIFRITNLIDIPEVINIKGLGTNSVIYLDGVNAGIKIRKIADSKILNEDGQLEGGYIRDIKFSSSRHVELNSALSLECVDHYTLDNVYWFGIKGKCLELKTVRESNFNNIFTRFSGTTEKGNIEIISNDVGRDISNLNFGMNWNIVYPYGSGIKFNTGDFSNIVNLTIHGIFPDINAKLANYFSINDYNSQGSNQIDLTSAKLRIDGASFSWCPDQKSTLKIDSSSCILKNVFSGGDHFSGTEAHGSGDYIFSLTNSSNLYLEGYIRMSTKSGNGDIINTDATSYVYGSMTYRSGTTYLNKDLKKQAMSSVIEYFGERDTRIKIKPLNGNLNTQFVGNGWNLLEFLDINSNPILRLGMNTNKTIPMTEFPSGSIINLPTTTIADTSVIANNSMWVDSSGNLKFKVNNTVYTITKS